MVHLGVEALAQDQLEHITSSDVLSAAADGCFKSLLGGVAAHG